jgi:hypothetical protein
MSPRDIGAVYDVVPAGWSDDTASFFDPDRRGRRRRAEPAKDDAALRRLLFGDMSLRGLGGLALVAGLLVVAAGVFVTNWDGPFGADVDRGGFDQRRMTDRDQAFGYAYADYVRRFDTGAAWSGWRADEDIWTIDPEALTTGGLFCLLGVGLLAVGRRRTGREND